KRDDQEGDRGGGQRPRRWRHFELKPRLSQLSQRKKNTRGREHDEDVRNVGESVGQRHQREEDRGKPKSREHLERHALVRSKVRPRHARERDSSEGPGGSHDEGKTDESHNAAHGNATIVRRSTSIWGGESYTAGVQ